MQLPEFKRDIVSIIANRLQEKRNFMQVIIGPRQVGKTTAINQASIPQGHEAGCCSGWCWG